MKKFITKKNHNNYFIIYLIIVIVIVYFVINYYNKRISPKLIDIVETKIEEVTNLYVKNNIVPEQVYLDKLITITKNAKDEIISVDIETNYANTIMVDVVKKIQNNISDFNIKDANFIKKDNQVYIKLPLMLAENGVLFQNFGPKVPVKVTFYEHAFGNIEVELVDYGINNALIKIILSITLESKIYIPYKEIKNNKIFSLIIGSKIINGTVPNFYNTTKTSTPINNIT